MKQRAMIALGGSLLSILGSACSEPAPRAPRNVLLIVVDTLRADHTGLGGYGRDTTPVLDELAGRPGAVNFAAARSTAPWTKPSVASILTGLEPEDHGVTAHPEKLHSDFTTLAEAFKARGYSTGGVQSNMLLASIFGYDQGFDVWDEEHLATHDTSTGAGINAAAKSFLESGRDPSKPFFLYVHHYEPHFQYLRSGERWYPDYPGPLTGEETMDQLIGATDQLRDEERRFLEARYDAEILYQDQLIGELVRSVEELDLGPDTVIAITADHGEEFLEHGELSHQFKLYDELVHVPLLILDPAGEAASLLDAEQRPVSLVDLGHSLLELAGVDPGGFPGSTLGKSTRVTASTRVLGGAPPFAERDMLTIERWKLIRTRTGDGKSFELFDLVTDPGEQADLAEQRPELVAKLASELDAELARHRAESPAGTHARESIDLSAEQLQKMKDLGYF